MTLAGFEHAEDGRILVGERDVTAAAAYDRGFGMVFQRYALFPHMSVADNVGYPLKMRRASYEARRKLVNEALEMVDLTGFGTRRPDQLSGGQQQRVALARALVFRPSVLLMDEPLAALDRKLREQVQLEIRRLHRELGTTILYVTHDQEEAMVLADRMSVMRDGRLLQLGTPAELYDRPADTFVAGFLGRTNFVEGTLAKVTGDTAEVTVGDRVLRATMPNNSPLDGNSSNGSTIHLAVRPEQMQLQLDGTGIPGTVSEIIFTGATTSVRVHLGFASVDVAMMTDSRSRNLREGDHVNVSWSAEQARVYPKESVLTSVSTK
jgi:ABC-type Fe3+/spermidine/putrescine transport system ATPase subunit